MTINLPRLLTREETVRLPDDVTLRPDILITLLDPMLRRRRRKLIHGSSEGSSELGWFNESF